MPQRPIYKSIPRTLSSYTVIGMSSTPAVERKLALLAEDRDRRTAVVLFDAYRCSSTLLACFGAGIVGALIKEKAVDGSGTDLISAQQFAEAEGRELILGGELDGRPVPGGIIGNSPLDAFRHDIIGKLLYFQSTNFGRLFVRITEFADAQSSHCDLFVMGFSNGEATAKAVQAGVYERIMVAGAGFFECIAIEDMVLGGSFISALRRDLDQLDDDALAMLASYQAYAQRLDVLTNCWTARVLGELSKSEDIHDVLAGSRLPEAATARMRGMVLHVRKIRGSSIVLLA